CWNRYRMKGIPTRNISAPLIRCRIETIPGPGSRYRRICVMWMFLNSGLGLAAESDIGSPTSRRLGSLLAGREPAGGLPIGAGLGRTLPAPRDQTRIF